MLSDLCENPLERDELTATDVSDMLIDETWAIYLEALYVEYTFGHDDAIRYLNGHKPKIRNRQPIITEHGVNRTRRRTSTSRVPDS